MGLTGLPPKPIPQELLQALVVCAVAVAGEGSWVLARPAAWDMARVIGMRIWGFALLEHAGEGFFDLNLTHSVL